MFDSISKNQLKKKATAMSSRPRGVVRGWRDLKGIFVDFSMRLRLSRNDKQNSLSFLRKRESSPFKYLKFKIEILKSTRPVNRWVTIPTILALVLAIILGTMPNTRDIAQGAFTTSSTDADGNTQALSNTTNDTYTYDTSKDSSDSTLQQMGQDPNWSNGITRESSALKFNGTDSYVNAGTTPNLNGATTITVDAWIYMNATVSTLGACSTTSFTIIQRGSSHDVNGHMYFYVENYLGTPKIALDVEDRVTQAHVIARGGTTLSTKTWYHVAGVADATRVQVYLNGVSDGSVTYNGLYGLVTGSSSYAQSTKIGGCTYSSTTPTSLFNGNIDEVRISNTARYSGTFTPPRRLTEDANTALLYHFDEGTGSTVNDSSQNGNTGTLSYSTGSTGDGTTNGPIWQTGANAIMDGFKGCNPDTLYAGTGQVGTGNSCSQGGRTGAGNLTLGSTSSSTARKAYDVKVTGSNGLTMDGSNDYVTKTSFVGVPSGAYTVDAWFKLAELGREQHIAEFGLTQLYIASNNKLTVGNGGGLSPTGVTTLVIGQWYHAAAVYNTSGSAGFMLYLNGTLEASSTANTFSPTTSFSIGDYYGHSGAYSFHGSIDEVRVSNLARYTSNFTPSRRFATDGSTAGLWHLDEGTGTSVADVSGNTNTGTLMNGSGNSPAADGTTNGPLWAEGIAASNNSVIPANAGIQTPPTSSSNWALPGYQFRKELKVTNNVASILNPGYGVETTQDRSALMDNRQMRSDGKDTRIVYQPSAAKTSLSFDGTNDIVTIPNSSSTNFDYNQNFTVEFWAKIPSTQVNTSQPYNLIIYKNNSNTATPYAIYINNQTAASNRIGELLLDRYDSSSNEPYLYSTKKYNDNQWHHFAYVKNSSSLTLYADGVLDVTRSDTAVSTTTNNNATVISSSSIPFTGSVDEVRISNTARYIANFTPATTPFAADSNTVGLWHLDEGSGQVVLDASGSNNNGTLGADSGSASDDPTWVTTDGAVSTIQEVPRFIPHGHTIVVNGSTGYVRNSSAVLSASPFTTELWFKNTDFAAAYTLLALGPTSGSNIAIQTTSASKIAFEVDGATLATGTTTLTANTWYHVALTYDANGTPNKSTLYLNGTKEVSQNTSAAFSVANITAGGSSATSPGTIYKGELDEIRVSSNVRYRNNFTTSTNPFAKDSFTSLLWHLDDGSGTSAADNSGNAYTGTITTQVWVTNGGKVDSINETQFKTIAPISSSGTDSNYYLYYGNLNESGSPQSYNSYGLKFDGTDDYVVKSGDMIGTGDVTISAFINPSGFGGAGGGRILDNGRYILDIESQSGSNGRVNLRSDAATNKYSATNSIVLNNNYLVTVTRTSAGVTNVYINGVLSGTANETSGTPAAGTTSTYIGNNSAFNRAFAGMIDDVRIYNRILTTTEITALYLNTPTVSNTSLSSWWKLDDSIAAGTSAADSAGSNTGTVTNFNFDNNSNWMVNATLLHASTEPSLTSVLASAEQETPIFFAWRQAGGTYSTSSQITPSPTQIGSEGVYLAFNPEGLYSRGDYYQIASWATEAFSTSSPRRGKERAAPDKMHVIATGGGIDIINARNNKLWMSFPAASNNVIGAGAPQQVTVLNGRIYVSSSDGLTVIQLDRDNAQRYTASGNSTYASNLANRNAASTYGAASGTALPSTTVNDASVQVIGTAPPKTYVGVATGSNMTVLANTTAANDTASTIDSAYQYAATNTNAYTDVFLTSGGRLYGANSTASTLDIYTGVNADVANQTSTTDVAYSTSSTPALRSGAINDISVTEGTSIADNGTSNQVALATNTGAEVINEHATQSSAIIDHHVRTGTTGSSNWSNKQFGQGLSLDGSNDYVNIPDANSLSPEVGSGSEMTIEAWIYPTSLTGSHYVVAKGNGSQWEYALWLSNAGLAGIVWTIGGGISSSAAGGTLTINTWNHIAMTYKNGSYTRAYLNGALVGSSTSQSGSPSNGTNQAYIGQRGDGSNFAGIVDEVRISSVDRYPAAFTPSTVPFASDSNTAGLYHLDERSGQTVVDASTSANNGTLGANSSVASDDPLRVSPDIAGSQDVAKAAQIAKSADAGENLSFSSATTQNVLIGNKLNQGAGQDFSYALWLKRAAMASSRFVLAKGAGTTSDPGFSLILTSGTALNACLSKSGEGARLCMANNLISDTNWHHIVVSYKRTGNGISYIDGVQNASVDVSGYNVDLTNAAKNLVLGASSSPSLAIDGQLDDVRFYSSALTPADVATLYNGGAGRSDSPISGLTAWWKMDEGSGQTVADSSGSGNAGTLGANSSVASDDPTWATGSPIRARSALWVGTNGSATGAVTDISLESNKQIASYTSSNSSLPSNNITSLAVLNGGLSLAGTDSGTWPAGLAGFPVDDTASTPAATINPVRAKSGGTVRIKGGTTRVKGN